MNLKINGTDTTIDTPSLTVVELLKQQNVDMPDMVSVQLNGEILERDAFENTTVKDSDEVEFLYFMGGGAIDAG